MLYFKTTLILLLELGFIVLTEPTTLTVLQNATVNAFSNPTSLGRALWSPIGGLVALSLVRITLVALIYPLGRRISRLPVLLITFFSLGVIALTWVFSGSMTGGWTHSGVPDALHLKIGEWVRDFSQVAPTAVQPMLTPFASSIRGNYVWPVSRVAVSMLWTLIMYNVWLLERRFPIAGKSAVVFGLSSGVGSAMGFVVAGARRVTLVGRNATKVENAVSELKKFAGPNSKTEIMGQVADCMNLESLDNGMKAIADADDGKLPDIAVVAVAQDNWMDLTEATNEQIMACSNTLHMSALISSAVLRPWMGDKKDNARARQLLLLNTPIGRVHIPGLTMYAVRGTGVDALASLLALEMQLYGNIYVQQMYLFEIVGTAFFDRVPQPMSYYVPSIPGVKQICLWLSSTMAQVGETTVRTVERGYHCNFEPVFITRLLTYLARSHTIKSMLVPISAPAKALYQKYRG